MIKTNAKRINDSSMSLLINDGINISRRSIDLFCDIDEDSVERIVRGVYLLLEKDATSPIDIYICSSGGDVYCGLFLFDFIRSLDTVEVRTHACGKVFSAASLVYLAGDIRTAYDNAVFMFHSVSTTVRGKAHELFTDSKETDALVKQMCEILSNNTSIDDKKWYSKIKFEDVYVRKADAIKCGIITKEVPDVK